MAEQSEMEALTEAFMSWVKNVKGITEIDIEDLIALIPEYEEHIKTLN